MGYVAVGCRGSYWAEIELRNEKKGKHVGVE